VTRTATSAADRDSLQPSDNFSRDNIW